MSSIGWLDSSPEEQRRMPLIAQVTAVTGGHRLRLTSDQPAPTAAGVQDHRGTADHARRHRPGGCRSAGGLLLRAGPTTAITPFIVLRAEDAGKRQRATVVHARLLGDPPGCFDEILARQVDTPQKFLAFLRQPGERRGMPWRPITTPWEWYGRRSCRDPSTAYGT